MTTSSERGIRILDESHYYWVWSAHGPSDQGMYYNRMFVRGMVPCPLPGDIAGDLEGHGFYLTPYVDGEWFSHWVKDENHAFHQRPVFAPIKTKHSDEFPSVPSRPPPRLPDEWVNFVALYTARGNLKKQYKETAVATEATGTDG